MIKKRIEVAVGVIKQEEKVLVGQRLVQDRYFQKWEFPGGKLDGDEIPLDALKRELFEELGISVISAKPLITLEHDYPDRHVRLFVYEIDQFSGQPKGVEGQALQWVMAEECYELDFLEANAPIIHAIQLPKYVFITDINTFGIEKTIDVLRIHDKRHNGNFVIQLRELGASESVLSSYLRLFREETNCKFIFLNGDAEQAYDLGFDGVQLNRHRANLNFQRLDRPHFWIGVSCHDSNELENAERFADFALLSPVEKTSSHPEAQCLGWQQFKSLVEGVKIPCYALGGMGLSDMERARQHGGQGVAAISSIWAGK